MIECELTENRRCLTCAAEYEHPTQGHGEFCSHDCWMKSLDVDSKPENEEI